MAINKDYSVEFDDSLLDMASWKNPRYNGSKLLGSQINKHVDGDPIYSYGLKPIIESKACALFIGNAVQDGGDVTSSLDPLVEIQNHSYVTIDTVLLINRETNEVTKISHEQFNETEEKKESFRRMIIDNFPEGSKIVTKVLDIATSTQLKESHHVKFNQGLLMKLYAYSADSSGNDDGVFGGYGVRDQKGTLVDKLEGGGLFGFGTTISSSASRFNETTITTVREMPSELSLYGTVMGSINELNPLTASDATTTIFQGDPNLIFSNPTSYKIDSDTLDTSGYVGTSIIKPGLKK